MTHNELERILYNTYKIDIKIDFIGKSINELWDDDLVRNQYQIIFTNLKTYKKAKITFWDSIYNTKRNIKPTIDNILSIVELYDHGSFKEFCCSFGYDTDSRRALQIYLEYQEQYHQLYTVLGMECIEFLQEVLNEL